MLKRVILLLVILGVNNLYSQDTILENKVPKDYLILKNSFLSSGTLILSGLCALPIDYDIRSLRNDNITKF